MIFALEPEINYYSKLIIGPKLSERSEPKIFIGDHLFFPNAYQHGTKNNLLLVENCKIAESYHRFNLNLKIYVKDSKDKFNHILVKGKNLPEEFWESSMITHN